MKKPIGKRTQTGKAPAGKVQVKKRGPAQVTRTPTPPMPARPGPVTPPAAKKW